MKQESLPEKILRGKKEFKSLVKLGYKKPRDWPHYKEVIYFSHGFFLVDKYNEVNNG